MTQATQDNREAIIKALKSQDLILISDYIVSSLPPLKKNNDNLFKYNKKYFAPFDDDSLGQYIYSFFASNHPKSWSPQKSRNIIEAIKFHPRIEKIQEFDKYPHQNVANFNNGTLDLDTYTLHPHDPKYLFTSCSPIDYDPTANQAPVFLKTIQGIFRNPDGTTDDKMCETIIQLGGCLLYPKVKVKKLFIFFGDGSNGKSIIMDTIYSMFFDTSSIANLSLNVLSDENNTARAELQTTRLNFATEQQAGKVDSTEIKKIVSGEPIACRALYKNKRVTFRPKVNILVSGNKRLFLMDNSHGANRRLMLMDFPNKFLNKHKYQAAVTKYKKINKTPEEKRMFLANNEDGHINSLKKEASAILNILLIGLKQLKENNWEFEEHRALRNAMLSYQEDADPVTVWLTNNWEEGTPDDFTSGKLLYDTYQLWFGETYKNNKRKTPMSSIAFGKKIRTLYSVDQMRNGTTNERGYTLRSINND